MSTQTGTNQLRQRYLLAMVEFRVIIWPDICLNMWMGREEYDES